MGTDRFMTWEDTAKYNLYMCHEGLKHANALEDEGFGWKAAGARKNAYEYGQDATYAFQRALQERNLKP